MLEHQDLPGVELEALVEQFETQWLHDRLSVQDFLSQRTAVGVGELVELIRCEMEFLWQDGHPRSLSDYESQFPALCSDPKGRADVAYEEFRQRQISGVPLAPEHWAQEYGIDIDRWPNPNSSQFTDSNRTARHRARLEHSNLLSLDLTARKTKRLRLQAGDEFADFTIAGPLGEGANGTVYLGTQGELAHRFVVLKIASFETREPQILAELQHTNIMPILSVHRREDWLALCMPFLGSVTLRDFQKHAREHKVSTVFDQACLETVISRKSLEIQKLLANSETRSSLTVRESSEHKNVLLREAQRGNVSAVLWLVQRIAEGLAHAHQHGIVHGDLKPANILISDDGNPLLLDFHLSQWQSRTGTAPEGGTLPYMSPEHLRAMNSEGRIDHRSDIYSLGVILYELLADRAPYPIPTKSDPESVAKMAIERNEPVKPLRSLVPRLSVDLDSIVQKCLAPNPADRYQECAHLVSDLSRLQQHLPLAFAPNRSITQRLTNWWRRNGRTARTSSLAVVSLGVCLFLGSFLIYRNRQLQDLELAQHSLAFQEQVHLAMTPLTVIGEQVPGKQLAIDQSIALLASRNAESVEAWLTGPEVSKLNAEQQNQEREQIAQLYFWLAHALHRRDVTSLSSREDERRRCSQLAENFAISNALKQAIEYQEFLSGDSNAIGLDPLPSIQVDQLQSTAECLMLASALASKPNRQFVSERKTLEQLLHRATELEPTHFVAWLMLGNYQVEQGEHASAIASFTMSIALSPSNTRGYFHRGLAYFEHGDFSQAAADFQAVLDRTPEENAARFNLAVAQYELALWSESEKNISLAIHQSPTPSAQFYLTRAKIRGRQSELELAKQDLLAGSQASPTSELEWIARALCHYQLGQVDQAVSDLESTVARYHDSTAAWQNLAHLFAEQKQDLKSAIAMMDQVVSHSEQHSVHQAHALATRGILYARLGDDSPAIADAQRAMELHPVAEVLFQVAGIHALLSLPGRAADDLGSRASEMSPEEHLEQAIRLLGRAAWEAPAVARRKLEQDPDLASLRIEPAFAELDRALRTLESMGNRDVVGDAK